MDSPIAPHGLQHVSLPRSVCPLVSSQEKILWSFVRFSRQGFFFLFYCISQWLNVQLWSRMNTEHKTGLALVQREGDVERVAPWPGAPLETEQAHSLSSLKDCSLIKNAPSNLISCLQVSESPEQRYLLLSAAGIITGSTVVSIYGCMSQGHSH